MVDRYTKVVLTVIATALTIISAQGFMKPATAQGYGQQVHVIVDSVAGYAFQFAGPLTVHNQ